MDREKTPHVRIEFDPDFDGGDYSGTGSFLLVPLSEVESLGAEPAFEARSGLPSSCMVHHTLEELYDADGERIDPASFTP